jgi:hypothetical protein
LAAQRHSGFVEKTEKRASSSRETRPSIVVEGQQTQPLRDDEAAVFAE